MKYAIWFTFFILGMGLGVVGTDYHVRANFYGITNVTWKQLTDGAKQCEQQAQERCAMYGGFAPRSQFSDR
jgi:hypothetical protein